MTTRTTCRICDHTPLQPILSLGKTPLANSLRSAEQLHQPEPTYPLDLVFCPNCTLVQITETVPPEVLFSHYLYFSSFSDTVLDNAAAIAKRLIEQQQLNETSLVMEIASNDGYLLKNYVASNIPVLGIEPAQNIAEAAQKNGIATLAEFFNADLARRLASKGQFADIIHANNVLAHVADLNSLVEGIAIILKPNGLAVLEMPYVKEMLDHTEFDTIYHEHLCYFSLTALDHLFEQHHLHVIDVERLAIHGGTLRILASKEGTSTARKRALMDEERAWGVHRFEFYQQFSEKIAQLRKTLRDLLTKLKAEGKRIAVYGASAKGCTLLHYFSLGSETLDFVVDRSSVKQGYYTPGTHLPIYAPSKLLEVLPDYVLLLTWNFADEILRQQEAYLARGGHFIVPIPEVRIV